MSIIHRIETFAKECCLDRVILFGSRARGTNRERSDIALAVSGGNLAHFEELLEEKADTLLSFDVINMDGVASRKLKDNIQREGVLLYAKV